MTEKPLLEVKNLETQFRTEDGTVKAVDGVSYSIEHGETYGVVGESGAGKSVTGLSIIDLIESPGDIVDGEVLFKGQDLLSLSESELREIRGDEITMIFQDALSALNPVYTIKTQITDVLLAHKDITKQRAREKAVSLLSEVGIPNAQARIDDYPHQFSGGMRQRVLIAMALACDPDLIIADEPTTALDVTIQAQILKLFNDIQREKDVAIQLISHNIGVIAQVCDRMGVMYAGEIIEEGPVEQIFEQPRHPYTVGLLKSIPRLDDPRERLETIKGSMPDLVAMPEGCSFADRCPHAKPECRNHDPELEPLTADHQSACIRVDELDFEAMKSLDVGTKKGTDDLRTSEELLTASNLQKHFSTTSGLLDRLLGDENVIHAVDDVDLTLHEGETVGLVGESGCGKSTLGRTLTRIHEPDEGTIVYAGENLTELSGTDLKDKRSEIQMIFQDPFSSLNPRKTVEQIISRPLEIHGEFDSDEEKQERVVELLQEVGLNESHLQRYPHEFSGGQKQRIGIARALAVDPDFIVADEPVSALDVSVQAQVLNMMMDIQERRDLTYLFIAHDLNVVQHISDRIAVMYLGEIVEVGTVKQIFEPPYHPYTEILLSSIPHPDPRVSNDRMTPQGEPPDPSEPPSGCRFHTRCPYAMPEWKTVPPREIVVDGREHTISCHLFDEDVMGEKQEDAEEVLAQQEKL
jgi:peptide/nickel transport system ATP-binding protein